MNKARICCVMAKRIQYDILSKIADIAPGFRLALTDLFFPHFVNATNKIAKI